VTERTEKDPPPEKFDDQHQCVICSCTGIGVRLCDRCMASRVAWVVEWSSLGDRVGNGHDIRDAVTGDNTVSGHWRVCLLHCDEIRSRRISEWPHAHIHHTKVWMREKPPAIKHTHTMEAENTSQVVVTNKPLFVSNVQTIVNTANFVGVMGKGGGVL
jgi:hypothetical protein